MADLDKVTEFFGWCVVLNMALLVLTTLVIVLCRKCVVAYHARLFGIEEARLNRIYLKFLGHYKLITVTLFLVPYLALKIMAYP